ncbi:hypothetical protein DPSP01_006482 [Paraphaeosphaeria sporulosa]
MKISYGEAENASNAAMNSPTPLMWPNGACHIFEGLSEVTPGKIRMDIDVEDIIKYGHTVMTMASFKLR